MRAAGGYVLLPFFSGLEVEDSPDEVAERVFSAMLEARKPRAVRRGNASRAKRQTNLE